MTNEDQDKKAIQANKRLNNIYVATGAESLLLVDYTLIACRLLTHFVRLRFALLGWVSSEDVDRERQDSFFLIHILC